MFPFEFGGGNAKAVFKPARGFDMGAGPGKALEAEIEGGTTGIIIDCRGRQPFVIPESPKERVEWLGRWTDALDAYPKVEG